MSKASNRAARVLRFTLFFMVAAGAGGALEASELRVGVASHVRSLDVNEATGNNEAQFLHNIFDTLIERDNYASPLKFVPGLALSWKMVSPTSMELKLRDGVVQIGRAHV